MVVRDIGNYTESGAVQPDKPAASEIHHGTSARINGEWTGFPKTSGQSLSYWLQSVRCDPLLDHRTTPDLPRYADTVIIGSGVSILCHRTFGIH